MDSRNARASCSTASTSRTTRGTVCTTSAPVSSSDRFISSIASVSLTTMLCANFCRTKPDVQSACAHTSSCTVSLVVGCCVRNASFIQHFVSNFSSANFAKFCTNYYGVFFSIVYHCEAVLFCCCFRTASVQYSSGRCPHVSSARPLPYDGFVSRRQMRCKHTALLPARAHTHLLFEAGANCVKRVHTPVHIPVRVWILQVKTFFPICRSELTSV
jgi:hypothetical protein